MPRPQRTTTHPPMKTAIFMMTALLPVAALGQVNSGSNGSDGALEPTEDLVINMADHPDGIYQYTSVNIPPGVTVTFKSNANNTPVTWLAQTDCVISGTVDLSGMPATGTGRGVGGPGGFSGGNSGGTSFSDGEGPGGGPAGPRNGYQYGEIAGSASFEVQEQSIPVRFMGTTSLFH